eukprot:1136856-Pelagomonas_calceolata.AAC.2
MGRGGVWQFKLACTARTVAVTMEVKWLVTVGRSSNLCILCDAEGTCLFQVQPLGWSHLGCQASILVDSEPAFPVLHESRNQATKAIPPEAFLSNPFQLWIL